MNVLAEVARAPKEHAPEQPSIGADLLVGGLEGMWKLTRWMLGVALAFIGPLVRVVFGGLALVSVLSAVFFRFVTALENPPFWTMLAFGIGCALLVASYEALLRMLGR